MTGSNTCSLNINRDKVIYKSKLGFTLTHRKQKLESSQCTITEHRDFSCRCLRPGRPAWPAGK